MIFRDRGLIDSLGSLNSAYDQELPQYCLVAGKGEGRVSVLGSEIADFNDFIGVFREY